MERIVYKSMEQRSPEWYQMREGKITASKIINILGDVKTAKCKDAIDNMAMIKAIETVHGMTETEYINFDMQRGMDNEPSAFALASEIVGNEFITVENVGFVSYGDHIGCSPDGILSTEAVLEIKCPNETNFFKLQITENIDKSHIAQMQHQMFCTGYDNALYFAYCESKGKEYYFMQVINRDDDMIKLIEERCNMVTDLKLKYIDILRSKL